MVLRLKYRTSMPRRPRNYIPGYPYHLVQRGVNKSVTFFDDDDRRHYLELWQRHSLEVGLEVHAFCLMSNHIHFVVTPNDKSSISNATRLIGSAYAARMNKKYQRTGTLWEGRHWSSLIDADAYLLSCYRYIELNPVRAGLSKSPIDYQWSSYQHNCGMQEDGNWLTSHAVFLALGNDIDSRRKRYSEFVLAGIPNEELVKISSSFKRNRPLASQSFIGEVEQQYQVHFGYPHPGRPWPK